MTTLTPDAPPQAQRLPESRIRVIYRDGGGEMHLDWPADKIAQAIEDPKGTLWVDIEDAGPEPDRNVEALLKDVFRFHPLAIEDALKDTHVPKVDDWGDYLYIVFQTIGFSRKSDHVQLHELDIFLGRNYLVTYHNEVMPVIEQIRRNIERDPATRLRHGAAHALYHVLDMSVAEYMPAIGHLDEAIDGAQEEVFRWPTPLTLQGIFRIKRSALKLHRILSPQREVLNRLARDDYDPINPDVRIYFRDVYDNVVRIHDIMEGLRDLISGALDTYLSAISNRTNDIMKALTLVTVMFLPMTFLAGFFGMNFFGDNIVFHTPLPKGTLFTLTCLVMFVTPGIMYLWARRRRWF